jgi:putative hydrolase of the HAD superfamily
VLDKIKQQHTITTNILSNTAFVKGNELRTVLKDLNLEQYFDFQIYSDEVLVSKPNGTIFELVYNTIIKMDVSTMDIEKPNIMHVGDNPIADIKGATDAGFQAFQINTNHLTITDLLS